MLLLVFALCRAPLAAQTPKRTDAERMGFAGAVQTVSMVTDRSDLVWDEPDGPALVDSTSCFECEFDRDGNQIKSGRIIDGTFYGEVLHLLRDGQGHVIERIAENPSTRGVVRHEFDGPFGKTEELTYGNGELQNRVLVTYDGYGHMSESLTLDSAGKQTNRTQVSTDKDGNYSEQWNWGKEGEFGGHTRQTVDAVNDLTQFTSFDESGSVTLTFTFVGDKLAFFWERPESSGQLGDNFVAGENGTFDNYDCHSGSCTRSRVHYVYLDPKDRNPESAERSDASGNLLYAVYYEYEMDSHRNWTRRKVWAWSTKLGDRKLYESDSRSITYWPE
jgi:hypothetical protein